MLSHNISYPIAHNRFALYAMARNARYATTLQTIAPYQNATTLPTFDRFTFAVLFGRLFGRLLASFGSVVWSLLLVAVHPPKHAENMRPGGLPMVNFYPCKR